MTRTGIRRRFPVALVFVALIALVLAACGGDGNDDTQDAPAPPAQQAPPVVDHADLSRLTVGEPAPDFSLLTATGDSVSLADYQGQPVLLFFHMAAG